MERHLAAASGQARWPSFHKFLKYCDKILQNFRDILDWFQTGFCNNTLIKSRGNIKKILKKLFFESLRGPLKDLSTGVHTLKPELIELLFYAMIRKAEYDFKALFQKETIKKQYARVECKFWI